MMLTFMVSFGLFTNVMKPSESLIAIAFLFPRACFFLSLALVFDSTPNTAGRDLMVAPDEKAFGTAEGIVSRLAHAGWMESQSQGGSRIGLSGKVGCCGWWWSWW
jgi:hypothetical protein